MTLIKPQQLVLEPPQAKVTAVNLIKHHKPFACEMDDGLVKDAVCIGIGAQIEARPDTHDYAQDITYETLDDASQFAVNCIDHKLCFSVRMKFGTSNQMTWSFFVERSKRFSARRASRY